MTPPPSDRVAAVILNWRRADDTIACVASVAALDYENLDIIVCDNDSQDGSIEAITAALSAALPAMNRARAGAGRRPFRLDTLGPDAAPQPPAPDTRRLCVIATGRNGGYAFGNNAGIRAAMTAPDLSAVWILNNDTLVDPAALTHLTARLRTNPAIGICGALVLYQGRPDVVQTLGGGRFLKWRARGEQLGTGLKRDALPDARVIEASLDYVNGAAALVTRRLLDTIGPMDDGYFLYFEEVDWATRARAAGFTLGYAPDAIVYHQVGAATGTDDDAPSSATSIYYAEQSKFRFLRKHHPAALTIAIPLMLRAVVRHRMQGRDCVARAMLRGAIGLPLRS